MELFYYTLIILNTSIFLIIYGEYLRRHAIMFQHKHNKKVSILIDHREAILFAAIMTFVNELKPILEEFDVAKKINSFIPLPAAARKKIMTELPNYSEYIKQLKKIVDGIERPTKTVLKIIDESIEMGYIFKFFGFSVMITTVVTFFFFSQFAPILLFFGSMISALFIWIIGLRHYRNHQREKEFLKELNNA